MITDHTPADYPNPGHVAVSFNANGITARYVRVTATKLWNRHRGDTPYCFALAQLQVFSNGANAALKAPVTAQDSVENWGWGKTCLTDGRRFSGDAAARATPAGGERKPSSTIQLRKEFAVEKDVRRALVFVCGLGQYELRLNGRKVGDRVLDPGWTNYRKTCLYVTYDVTAQLDARAQRPRRDAGQRHVQRRRAAGTSSSQGSFGPPKLILQLYVEYADGTSAAVVSDGSWTWAPGPIGFLLHLRRRGLRCAAGNCPAGTRPGSMRRRGQPALVVDGPGRQAARSQAAPPIKVMQEFKPVKVDRSPSPASSSTTSARTSPAGRN